MRCQRWLQIRGGKEKKKKIRHQMSHTKKLRVLSGCVKGCNVHSSSRRWERNTLCNAAGE